MNGTTLPTGEKQTSGKSRRGLWWAVGGGALALCVVAAAIIVVPRLIYAQRVADYTDVMTAANTEITETNHLRTGTDRITVLYSLQFEEAGEFHPMIEKLADYTDHYFTEEDLASLKLAGENLATAVEDHGLSDDEAATVKAAKDAIKSGGIMWQTDFLNLPLDAMEQLIEVPQQELLMPVADDDVTAELVDSAQEQLVAATADRNEAETAHAAVQDRATALTDAVTATLEPLSNAAKTTPAQVKVVLDMYPKASKASIRQLRGSAQLAVDSLDSKMFTQKDDTVMPLSDDAPEGAVKFEVTDAWRSVLVAIHLQDYSDAITAAWLSDAGGVEKALGFNPYLPYF